MEDLSPVAYLGVVSRVDEFEAAYHQQLIEQVAEMVWDQARSELEHELHELRARNAELRRQLENEAQVASLRLREVQSEVVDLKDRNAELVAAKKNAEQLADKLRGVEHEVVDLRAKCAALGHKANKATQQIYALEAIRSRLGRVLKKSDRIHHLGEMERSLLRARNVELEQAQLDSESKRLLASLTAANEKPAEAMRRLLNEAHSRMRDLENEYWENLRRAARELKKKRDQRFAAAVFGG